MGFIADYYLDKQIEKEEYEKTRFFNKQKKLITEKKWQMKDGKLILIKDMDDNHLSNVYKMVLTIDKYKNYKLLIEQEIKKRNERI